MYIESRCSTRFVLFFFQRRKKPPLQTRRNGFTAKNTARYSRVKDTNKYRTHEYASALKLFSSVFFYFFSGQIGDRNQGDFIPLRKYIA